MITQSNLFSIKETAMWDTRFDERDVKEIRTKTTTYLGVGAIAKIDDIAADLKARGIDSILCVTSQEEKTFLL